MNEVTTTQARTDFAKARAGEIPLPKITHMALGTGGHQLGDVTKPVPPNPDAISLEAEVLRKVVTVTRNVTAVNYKCEIGPLEANGVIFTEAALIDQNGKVVAFKTFGGKTKENDVSLSFDWDENF